jgi:hypothetical protein
MYIYVVVMLAGMAWVSTVVAVIYMSGVIDIAYKGSDGRFPKDDHPGKFKDINQNVLGFWVSVSIAVMTWVSTYYVGHLDSAITIQTIEAPHPQFIKAPPPCAHATPEAP